MQIKCREIGLMPFSRHQLVKRWISLTTVMVDAIRLDRMDLTPNPLSIKWRGEVSGGEVPPRWRGGI